ncbi:hypothetical protein JVU11DRAFT_12100 [Chiua virens]|nr:hypothetical protein JVU11DRAFT_12100 [Chiua virens]
MIVSTKHLLRRARIYFVFFANFTRAALQNVTIDDTVYTGAVVPQYLPSASSWNQGNMCSGCLVKPDSSKAYNWYMA